MLLAVAANITAASSLAVASKDASDKEAAIAAATLSLTYVPAIPSTVPDTWQAWEKETNGIIEVVGATARQKTNAADIYYESKRSGLEVKTVFALIEMLSRFDERATSRSGNVGLLQRSESTRLNSSHPRLSRMPSSA